MIELVRKRLWSTPISARVAPYVIIVALTFLQESSDGPSRYWLYLVKMLVGVWCIWEVRSVVTEARWALSWEAVVVGVAVCAVWVGLDPCYGKMSEPGTPWNPFKQFGEGTAMGFFFVGVRTVGSALVVPPIEEAFYRSFLYRYFVRTNFTELPLSRLHWLSFAVTAAIFGLAHYQWLAGILCAMAYQGLVIRKNRLGDAMTAHAITNFLLGIWVVGKNAWQFW